MKNKMSALPALLLILNAMTSLSALADSHAKTAAPVAAAPAQAQAFKVDAGTLTFDALVQPSSLHVVGTSTKMTGEIKKTGNSLSGFFQVPLADFDTKLSTRNTHLKEKVFEIPNPKYDTAKLAITELKIPAGQTGEIKDLPFAGTLSFHGTDKPVSGTATVTIGEKSVTFDAKFGIANYSDFNIPVQKFTIMTVQPPVQVEATGEGKL